MPLVLDFLKVLKLFKDFLTFTGFFRYFDGEERNNI